MFKKPLAHQSNATPIRSSARRQLVAAIIAQHPSLVPQSGSDDDTGTTDVAKEVAKVILPEGVRTGNIETSGGTEGTVYYSPDGDPLWMSLGRGSKEYIPTLSLLALPLPHPPLPILQLHYPLPPPILTGAPLFVPALRNLSRPHLLPDVPENGLVAFVVSRDNGLDVSYVGVGRVAAKGGVRGAVERRIRKLKADTDDDEGKFCDILCIIDDHLWELGTKSPLPTFPLPAPLSPLVAPPQSAPGPSRPRTPTAEVTRGIENLNVDTAAAAPIPGKALPLSPTDISTLLTLALLQALSSDAVASLSFPIPASQLYSGQILPNRPAFIPKHQRDDVVIGKSEWKKLGKWMKEASKDGLLKTKEVKGEAVIQSFDVKHPSLLSHEDFLTIAQDDARAAKRAAKAAASGEGTTSGAGGAKSKVLDIEELWRPNGTGVAFWEVAGVDKTSLNPTTSLRTVFEAYAANNGLVDARNHRMISLDANLVKAVGVKGAQPGEQMTRDEVLNKLRAGVAWMVSINGVVKKGALQPITMAVKTRQGRKMVTIVTGLETFGVDADDFAEEMRKRCAGSASVQPLNGASPKLNLKEIMVQGPQVKIITEALVEKGIPKRWIKEVDGGKKK